MKKLGMILILAAAAQGVLADNPSATPESSALSTMGRNPTWDRAQASISAKAAKKIEESIYVVDSKMDSQLDAVLSGKQKLELAVLN